MVADDEFDRDVAPGSLAVGDSLLHAGDGDGAAEVAIEAGLVAQDADLDARGPERGRAPLATWRQPKPRRRFPADRVVSFAWSFPFLQAVHPAAHGDPGQPVSGPM
jgi:hypothetical protein